MKKIICFFLVIFIISSVFSCSPFTDVVDSDTQEITDSSQKNEVVSADTDSNSTSVHDTETTADDIDDEGASEEVVQESEEQTTKNPNRIDADKYDGVFKTGFARVDITPGLDVPQRDGTPMTRIEDPLYATCIAVNDGEDTALIYTVDLCNVPAPQYNSIRERVSEATKVPEKNIVISAVHNHSACDLDSPAGNDALRKWTAEVKTKMVNAATQAIADLAESEIYVGTAKTTGMAFVRRYLHEDGSYSGVWTGDHMQSSSKIIAQASEPDDTLQLIRLVRKDKKDIVMTNWQAHLAHAIDSMPTTITADLAYFVRNGVETRDDDALIAYFAGASGNINLKAPTAAFRKYKNYQAVGTALSNLVLKTMPLENLTKLEAGKISVSDMNYKADSLELSQERVEQAKEVRAAENDPEKKRELMIKYGFESDYHYKTAITLGRSGPTKINLYIETLSFGDLAFVAAPYEMFDTNGMQIKDASPFNMTFILTCAGGAGGYIASAEAVSTYGGYEVYRTDFAYGTAEKLVDEYLKMLKAHKGIS